MKLSMTARTGSAGRTEVINYILRTRPQFTVLVGSRARRRSRAASDIDLVRIGHKRPAPTRLVKLGRPARVSYIDYDAAKFAKLYGKGSLFLYHVFNEGKLLEGNRATWEKLRDRFKVQTNFSAEISQNRKILNWLQRGRKAEGAAVPYLAHTFRALKNLAIFSLAQRRKYVFDKRDALRQAFPQLDSKCINVLMDANDFFEESTQPRASYDVELDDIAHVKKEVGGAVHCSAHANP